MVSKPSSQNQAWSQNQMPKILLECLKQKFAFMFFLKRANNISGTILYPFLGSAHFDG